MNGPILVGGGIAIIAWGGVAILYGYFVTGVALLAAGIFVLVLGQRWKER